MENANVIFKSVVNATFRVDNSNDEQRIYDISADANVIGSRIDNFQNGIAVCRDNRSAMCTFTENDSPYLIISFSNMNDVEVRTEAIKAVSAFINDARSSVPTLNEGNV